VTDTSEVLLRAATYLKWWRDGAIAGHEPPPDDIGEMIIVLEQLANQLERGVPDEWESAEFRAHAGELPEDE
jgi:hypothetical protein